MPHLPGSCPPPGSTLVAEGSGEPWEALTDAADVVAGPAAVHAEGAGLRTAVAVEPRGADWGAREGGQLPKGPQPACSPLQCHTVMKGGSSNIRGEPHPPHTLEGLSLCREELWSGPVSTEELG